LRCPPRLRATGTPGGICAIASSASTPVEHREARAKGTPITGRSVWRRRDARQRRRQARAADQDLEAALARGAAVVGYRIRLPVRERTSNSYAIPRLSSSSKQTACARGRTPSRRGFRRRPQTTAASCAMSVRKRAPANEIRAAAAYARSRASLTVAPSR
jgi:hypothetical protein